MDKKGVSMSVGKTISVVVGIVILFTLMAAFIPLIQTAGDDLNATGAPFGSLFASNGIAVTLVMVGVLLAVLAAIGISRKGR